MMDWVDWARRAWLLMNESERVRCVLTSLIAAMRLVFAAPSGTLELRVVAWNLERLDDVNGAGCVGREDGDHTALAECIDVLGASIVADVASFCSGFSAPTISGVSRGEP